MQYRFDGVEGSGLPPYEPPCRERCLPGGGLLYVHGYCPADVDGWRRLANQFAGLNPAQDPPEWALEMAQMVWVCRTAPGSEQRTFAVVVGGHKQAAEQFKERLPGRFIRSVCVESDALALVGYLPASDEASPHRAAAKERIGLMLADRKAWAHLDWLCQRLYGTRLCERQEPLADVLNVAAREQQWQEALLTAIGTLGRAAGGLA